MVLLSSACSFNVLLSETVVSFPDRKIAIILNLLTHIRYTGGFTELDANHRLAVALTENPIHIRLKLLNGLLGLRDLDPNVKRIHNLSTVLRQNGLRQ